MCGFDVKQARRDWRREQPAKGERAARRQWRARRPRWEADHILPVADGGGECGLENYRLLCRTCHLGVTAQWRRLKIVVRVAMASATEGAHGAPATLRQARAPRAASRDASD